MHHYQSINPCHTRNPESPLLSDALYGETACGFTDAGLLVAVALFVECSRMLSVRWMFSWGRSLPGCSVNNSAHELCDVCNVSGGMKPTNTWCSTKAEL
eukprot:4910205-Amphidinium_carterae.1